MMIWVNTIAIAISAYLFAYGIMRTAAFVLPRVVSTNLPALPLGAGAAISLIGFCMVTGSPGATVLAMIIVAVTQLRHIILQTSPGMHRLALLLAALLVGSLFITRDALSIPNVSVYILAAGAAAILSLSLFLLDNAEPLRVPVLLLLIGLSFAAPLITAAPYHVALDALLVLLCMVAFQHTRRHVRIAVMLDGAFTLPAAIILLHGMLMSCLAIAKGL